MRRRDLAGILLAGATPAAAAAQTAPAEGLSAARQEVKNNSAALASFPIPMSTEPAFVFKA